VVKNGKSLKFFEKIGLIEKLNKNIFVDHRSDQTMIVW